MKKSLKEFIRANVLGSRKRKPKKPKSPWVSSDKKTPGLFTGFVGTITGGTENRRNSYRKSGKHGR